MGEKRTILGKGHGIKVWCYLENLVQHIENIKKKPKKTNTLSVHPPKGSMLHHPCGSSEFLFLQLFVTIFNLG
jgi:uncharacterized protein YqhQ